mmetsp:Transcript_12235/g.16698  ORF Transcript_12235/g.16698 Transcript_12235/m.16698 type:complete len:330 (+) Transcript_12235:298-1287(+)
MSPSTNDRGSLAGKMYPPPHHIAQRNTPSTPLNKAPPVSQQQLFHNPIDLALSYNNFGMPGNPLGADTRQAGEGFRDPTFSELMRRSSTSPAAMTSAASVEGKGSQRRPPAATNAFPFSSGTPNDPFAHPPAYSGYPLTYQLPPPPTSNMPPMPPNVYSSEATSSSQPRHASIAPPVTNINNMSHPSNNNTINNTARSSSIIDSGIVTNPNPNPPLPYHNNTVTNEKHPSQHAINTSSTPSEGTGTSSNYNSTTPRNSTIINTTNNTATNSSHVNNSINNSVNNVVKASVKKLTISKRNSTMHNNAVNNAYNTQEDEDELTVVEIDLRS